MDKKEALSLFVKENASLLSSRKATSDLVKQLRKNFYEKIERERITNRNYRGKVKNKAPAIFTIGEIASDLAKLIVVQRKPTLSEFIEMTSAIPFFEGKISRSKLESIHAENSQVASESVIKPSDLSKMNQDDYIKKIEKQYNDKAKERAEEELLAQRKEIDEMRLEIETQRTQMETERTQMEKFKSELDLLPESASLEVLEEYVDPISEDSGNEKKRDWWEMLELESNPFPSSLGLDEIEVSKYSEIVVSTSLISSYLDKMTNNPQDLLGKNILLIGEHGSGKTTIFDYLKFKAGNGRILPIKMTLSVIPSGESLINGMLHQIYDNISETYKIRKEYDPRREKVTGDLQITISNLLRDLQSDGTEGFLILIDGLNKEEEYLDRVFQFLRYLQNIQELLSNRSVRAGFLVAGAGKWKKDLAEIPSLSGTFYRVDEILPITENEAIEALLRRLKSFTLPDKETPKVKLGSLRQAYRVIKQRKGKVTFRSFLTDIREKLQDYEFDEVGLEVDIHIETVDAVHAYFQRTVMAKNFNEINSELGKNLTLRKACRKVIRRLYKSGTKGMLEQNDVFQSNKGAFYLLRKFGFISQVSITSDGIFKWYLSPEYRYAVTEVCEKLRIDVEGVIKATFEEEIALRERESYSIYSSTITSLSQFVNAWIDSYPLVARKLNETLSTVTKISNIPQNIVGSLDERQLKEPVANIVDSINYVLYGEEISSDERWEFFKKSWASTEYIAQAERFLKWSFDISVNETTIYGILQDHSQVISDLLILLSDLIVGEGIARLSKRRLSLKEFNDLHSIRMHYNNQNYKVSAEKSRELAESAIRNNIYHAMRAIWGSEHLRLLPKDLQASLDNIGTRGPKRLSRGPDINFLYDLSRSEYSKVLLHTPIYKAIFSDLLNDYDKGKLTDFLSLMFSLGDRKAHDDRASYFSQHASEIRDSIQKLPWFLEIMHEVAIKFVSKSNFEYDFNDAGISAAFLNGSVHGIQSSEITINEIEAKGLLRYYLEYLSNRDITIDSLESISSKPNTDPEFQIAVVRIISATSLIYIKSDPISLNVMSITLKGKKRLAELNNREDFTI